MLTCNAAGIANHKEVAYDGPALEEQVQSGLWQNKEARAVGQTSTGVTIAV